MLNWPATVLMVVGGAFSKRWWFLPAAAYAVVAIDCALAVIGRSLTDMPNIAAAAAQDVAACPGGFAGMRLGALLRRLSKRT